MKHNSSLTRDAELALMLQVLPGFVYRLHRSPEGHFHYDYVGGACEAMFGVSPETVLADADSLLQMIHEDDLVQVMGTSLLAAETGQPWRQEFRMIRGDGQLLWVEAHDTGSLQADGSIVWTGYAIDISDRKSLENALKDSESRFRSFVENVNDIIYTLSSDTCFTYVSPNWQLKLGHATEAVLGRSILDFLHPDDWLAYQTMLAQVLKDGQRHEGLEFRMRHSNGEWRWQVSTASRVEGHGERPDYLLGVAHDIGIRKHAEEQYRFLAHHDSLTRLANREGLLKHLSEHLAGLTQDQYSLALIYMDLDKFKPVNDVYGHAMGDLLLKAVAGRILGCLRTSDFVARIGGDEFIILLKAVRGAQDVLKIAEKLRLAMDAVFEIGGEQLRIACSIGIAMAPQHGTDGEALIALADQAMYQAKSQGRNRCVLWPLPQAD